MSAWEGAYLEDLLPALALLELLPDELVDALPLLAAWGGRY